MSDALRAIFQMPLRKPHVPVRNGSHALQFIASVCGWIITAVFPHVLLLPVLTLRKHCSVGPQLRLRLGLTYWLPFIANTRNGH